MPKHAIDGAAGYDVYSTIDIIVPPLTWCLIPLDFKMSLPEGTYVQLLSWSGQWSQHWVGVQAGVIDSDYRGNVKVLLHNHNNRAYKLQQGDWIAQMGIIDIAHPTLLQTDTATTKNDKDFGSTVDHTIIWQVKDVSNDLETSELHFDKYLS